MLILFQDPNMQPGFEKLMQEGSHLRANDKAANRKVRDGVRNSAVYTKDKALSSVGCIGWNVLS